MKRFNFQISDRRTCIVSVLADDAEKAEDILRDMYWVGTKRIEEALDTDAELEVVPAGDDEDVPLAFDPVNACNTRISYLYRDAANWKQVNEVVIEGELTEAAIDEIMSALDSGEWFIPRQVGLPERRFETWDEENDHCWFELSRDGFEITSDEPTMGIDAMTLLKAFRKAKEEGWRETT